MFLFYLLSSMLPANTILQMRLLAIESQQLQNSKRIYGHLVTNRRKVPTQSIGSGRYPALVLIPTYLLV